jgi:hypothetical protein
MKNRIILLVGFLITLAVSFQGCTQHIKEQEIVDLAIEAHGGEAYEKAKISFDFRNIHYEILKTPSRFEYSREFSDSLGRVKDILTDEGFKRTIDGKEISLTEERRQAYSSSVNAVAYFAFLPYGLNDAAAHKRWVGESALEGNTYDVIEVTFSEDGGGEDYNDEFLYWINKENNRMDYLAYSYHTDGGGVRFRKAINSRTVNDIRMQDYENYKPGDKNILLKDMENLYRNGELELLSEILLENIKVEYVE